MLDTLDAQRGSAMLVATIDHVTLTYIRLCRIHLIKCTPLLKLRSFPAWLQIIGQRMSAALLLHGYPGTPKLVTLYRPQVESVKSAGHVQVAASVVVSGLFISTNFPMEKSGYC